MAVPHGYVPALPQGLDAVELGAGDGNALGVPEGGAAEFGQFAVGNGEALAVPEGVAQVEKAVVHPYVPAFLEGAFPIGGAVEGAVLNRDILAGIERPLLVKGLMLNL